MNLSARRPRSDAAQLLLVATGRHVNPSSLSRIRQAVPTARAFGAALTGDNGYFDARRTRLVADPADARQVLDPLRRMTRETGTDVLLFYYVGHGLLGRNDRLCLALTPTAEASAGGDPNPSLPFAEVANLLRESSATYKAAILDCCFSGRALGPDGHGLHILTASSPTRKALFPPDGTLTGFTGELLGILDAGIPDGARHLTLATLYDRLAVVLPTTPAPQTGLLPTGYPAPHQQTVDDSGHLCLAVNPAHGTGLTSTGLRTRAAFSQRLKKLTEPAHDNPEPDPARLSQLVDVLDELALDASEVLGPLHDFTITARRNLAAMTATAGAPDRAVTLLKSLATALEAESPDHPALPGVHSALAYWSGRPTEGQ